jgi:hypothetical protein
MRVNMKEEKTKENEYISNIQKFKNNIDSENYTAAVSITSELKKVGESLTIQQGEFNISAKMHLRNSLCSKTTEGLILSSVLIKMAGSTALNTALKAEKLRNSSNESNGETKESDKSPIEGMIEFVCQHSPKNLQDSNTGNTALLESIIEENYEIFKAIMKYMKNSGISKKNLVNTLKLKNKNGKNAIHVSIDYCKDEILAMLLETDVNNVLYFQPLGEKSIFSGTANNCFSLALALKNFHSMRNGKTMSIVKQLYFSLKNSWHRTQALEKSVYLGWGYTRTALWKYFLKYALDAEGQVDMYVIDTINDAINDGLSVWGLRVTWRVIKVHAYSYTGVSGTMLDTASKKINDNVANRTMNLANQNSTLAQLEIFWEKAQVGSNYKLMQHTKENKLKSQKYSIISLEKGTSQLYFLRACNITSNTRNKTAAQIQKIIRGDLSERRKGSYDALVNEIKKQTNISKRCDISQTMLGNIIDVIPSDAEWIREQQKKVQEKRSNEKSFSPLVFSGNRLELNEKKGENIGTKYSKNINTSVL